MIFDFGPNVQETPDIRCKVLRVLGCYTVSFLATVCKLYVVYISAAAVVHEYEVEVLLV